MTKPCKSTGFGYGGAVKKSAMPPRKSPMARSAIKPLPGILRTANLPAKVVSGKPGGKPPKCKVCRNQFDRKLPGQLVCGATCAESLARIKREKAERAALKVRREALKTRSDYLRDAQAAFNAFIRARDAGHPCISCLRYHKGKWNAGHYLSVGAHPELRFNEENVHKQCEPCNTNLSGNISRYRTNLIIRIGIVAVQWLEGPHEPAKYSIEEIKAIKAEYKAKLKALQANQIVGVA